MSRASEPVPALASRWCKRVCSDSCARARDGSCADGGFGDETPEGKPRCALGSDCSDCGARHLCSLLGTQLQLPAAVIPSSPPALRLAQVLFMVMGSSRYRQRTRRIYQSWCADEGVRCLFFSDDSGAAGDGGVEESDSAAAGTESAPFVRVQAAPPARSCCRSRGRSHSLALHLSSPPRDSTLSVHAGQPLFV